MQSQRVSQSPWAWPWLRLRPEEGGWEADGGSWAGGASSIGASIHGGEGRGARENQAGLFEALYIIHWPKPLKGSI